MEPHFFSVRTIVRHAPAIGIAVVVGLCTVVPQLIAEVRMGPVFQNIHPLVIDDQIYYLARAHETVDGHPTLGSAYLAERKAAPGVQFWIPDMLLAKLGLLFGSLRAGVLISQFVFPFLIVFLSYAIVYTLTRNRLLSLGVAILLDPGLVFVPFLRSPNPQLFVLLLVSILLLLAALRMKRRNLFLASAVLGGLLFYVYPFYWTYWVIMVGLMGAGAFLLGERTSSLRLFGGLFVAGIIGLPYLLDWHAVMQLPFYHESVARFGAIQSHMPSGPMLTALVAGTVVILFLALRKRVVPASDAIVVGGAALAGAIAINQQVITGINYFYTVHYTTFIYFTCAFALALALPPLVKNYLGKHAATLSYVFFAFAVVYAGLQAVPAMNRLATPQPSDSAAQRYGPVLTWLEANTVTDEVVYANPELSTYIPAYTRDNVLWAPYAFLSYMPQTEVEQRYLASHYLDGVFGYEELRATEADVFGLAFIAHAQHESQLNKVRSLLGLARVDTEKVREQELFRLASSSENIRAGTFEGAVAGMRIDYIVWDTVKNPDWRIDRVSGLNKRYEANGIVVYELP
ncbi:MAG: hypothetical protein ABA06_04705 [Parcubacteria bacterium C7867-001]|nr:MAG: hypothetical protein ABA06_04705 [Parcubacteria bacterium C7867-001]